MATSTDDIMQDEIERNNLQKAISDVETVFTVSTTGTRSLFENFLQNAKGRLATLEKRIKDNTDKRESEKREQVAIAYVAEKEAALDAHEQRTYDGFLKEEFFSKKDFGRLNEFYAHAYDRLSEKGKEQMDYRVWEGVRRNEYKLSELPQDVQDKTASRAYAALKDKNIPYSNVEAIPDAEKAKFLKTYSQGETREAEHILNNRDFSKNLATGSPPQPKTPGQADLSLSGVDLSNLNNTQNATGVSPTELAKANANAVSR